MEFAEAKSFLCEYMNLDEKEPVPRKPIKEDYTEALNTAHRHYKEEYEATCKDKNIFVAFGTAEVILFELLEIPYLCLQSDSTTYNLKNNTYFNKLKGHLKSKRLICLLE